MTRRVLIVTDSSEIAGRLEHTLEAEDVSLTFAETGTKALSLLGGESGPDLVLVQDRLPDMSGEELCRVCAAMTRAVVVQFGAETGAEHFADETAPGRSEPLLSTALEPPMLRMLDGEEAGGGADVRAAGQVLTLGPLALDLDSHTMTLYERTTVLTPTEMQILRHLIEQTPRVVAPEVLIERIWPSGEGGCRR
ncbi:MAG: response regulator transcription factor [Armatimonadota bacterium]|jgi:DNA-binding response OmpR family regulator